MPLLILLLLAPPDTSACLQRLAGRWVGEGTSFSTSVRDVATFEWGLGARFLRVTYRAEVGDSFAAEGYLWDAGGEVRFQEFSTASPVRLLSGTCDGDRLVLEERTAGKHIRLAFRFLTAATMEMTETDLAGARPVIFVSLRFQRQ
jgi:hypothetical protein